MSHLIQRKAQTNSHRQVKLKQFKHITMCAHKQFNVLLSSCCFNIFAIPVYECRSVGETAVESKKKAVNQI